MISKVFFFHSIVNLSVFGPTLILMHWGRRQEHSFSRRKCNKGFTHLSSCLAVSVFPLPLSFSVSVPVPLTVTVALPAAFSVVVLVPVATAGLVAPALFSGATVVTFSGALSPGRDKGTWLGCVPRFQSIKYKILHGQFPFGGKKKKAASSEKKHTEGIKGEANSPCSFKSLCVCVCQVSVRVYWVQITNK